MFTSKRGSRGALGLALLLASGICLGQATTGLSSRFVPGESMRYEFDGIVHLESGHVREVKLNIPEDCSYRLRAVLKFDFDRAMTDGSLTGRVRVESPRYDGPSCAIPPKSDLPKALLNLEANDVKFDITPAHDTLLSIPPAAADCEGVSVLVKAAWDLLQVQLSDKAITPGMNAVASRRFLYWPDTFVENMEVAAASMQYKQDAVVAGHPYAWLQYKQVFSPADVPAYVETRTDARDFTGTTFVMGKGNVSLLFDGATQRVVYLRRERTIDNRMELKYDGAASVALATYSIQEESTLRWLPEQNAEAWLAELHKFETAPEVRPAAEPGGEESPLAAVAAASRRAKSGAHNEIPESLDPVPRGFERWQNSYCSGGYCFDLSIAVPAGTKEAERTSTTVLLLSGYGNRTVTVAVGPMLDRQYEGLTDEELLKQQSTRFVGNYLWFAGSTGRKLNSESATLRDRPAAFTDFTAQGRDLAPLRGRLAMVVGPYGRLAPVTCSYAAPAQTDLEAICQTVTGSLLIH